MQIVVIIIFLSTLSLRRATGIIDIINNIINDFYPRSPCGERPEAVTTLEGGSDISIHALLAESDTTITIICIALKKFLSTLSLRRATDTSSLMQCQVKFLSTLSLRRATARRESRQQPAGISIHALLAESDEPATRRNNKNNIFLSTLSLRRATNCTSIGRPKRLYFYPRSPCGERPT